jgi:2-amino-4-hydroxy-6-hydroxymethyldihydropteridine diphosphokinase
LERAAGVGGEPVAVAIGLGSNLGDRRAHLRFGVERLREYLREIRVSPLYETDPEGDCDQPPFLNAVCVGRTVLSPRQLLSQLQDAERAAGRRRGARRFGPRTLDLDLLVYGNSVLRSAELTVPHPRLRERAFVLVPFADVAPDWIVPGESGRAETVARLLSRLNTGTVYPASTAGGDAWWES